MAQGNPGVGRGCGLCRSQRSHGVWTRPQERKFPERIRFGRRSREKQSRGWKAEVPWRRPWGQVACSTAKTCCGRLAREQEEKGREGGSEGRRKKSVVQPFELPESGEGMWQVYCVRTTSLVGCEQDSNGTLRRLERKFCSV